MNLFEFLLVMVSIVLGLSISELFGGVARILRGELAPAKLHTLWILIVFQIQAQMAWAIWGLRVKESWRYPEFLLLLFGPVILFMAAAVLFPSHGSKDNLESHLLRNRRPFFLLNAGYVVLTGIMGFFMSHVSGPLWVTVFRIIIITLFVILSITEKRYVHWAIGLFILASHLWWTYLFTFVMGTTPTNP